MPEEQRKSTSMKIRPSVWKAAKLRSVEKDMELSLLVEIAIEEYLKKK